MLRRDRTGYHGEFVANSFEILHLESRTLMSVVPWFAPPVSLALSSRTNISGVAVPAVVGPISNEMAFLIRSGKANVQQGITLPTGGVVNLIGPTAPVNITGGTSAGGYATVSSGTLHFVTVTTPPSSGTLIVNGVINDGGSTSGSLTLSSGTLITNNATVIGLTGVNLIAPGGGNSTLISGPPGSLQIGTVSNTGGIVLNQGGSGIVTLPGSLIICPGTFNPGSFLSLGTNGTAGTVTGLNTLTQPGSSSGATAIAVIDSYGNLTGINVVNPGIGYTLPPTITIVGGTGTAGTTITTGTTGTITLTSPAPAI